jgi:hypothetical protein
MTKEIADLMKIKLESLNGNENIVSTLAGLTRVFEYKGSDDLIKRLPFPLECSQPEPNCNECDELFILVPSEAKRCIVYFEGGVSTPLQNLQKATRYSSNISLVCWYNTKGFEGTYGLQSRLIALFSERCKSIHSPIQSVINGISVDITRVQDSDTSIFSKYTYSQDKSQYLGCPFSSFKIDFNIKYNLHENSDCFDGILAIAIPNC